MDQALSFRLIWERMLAAFMAVSLVIGTASPVSAQLTHGRIRQKSSSGPGFTACLAMEGEKCRLIAPAVAIAIGVENGDAIISYLDPSQAGYVVQRKESVAADLEKAASKGSYGTTQAALILAELLSMHELMYRLPADQTELKRAMGFPAQIVLTPEDQIGVLTSHLQLTLSVSAITADYLISKLGLQVLVEEKKDESGSTSGFNSDQPVGELNASSVGDQNLNQNQNQNQNLNAVPAEDPNLAPPPEMSILTPEMSL